LAGAFRHPFESLREREAVAQRDQIPEEVFYRFQPGLLEQLRVVGRVPGRHDHRGVFEAADEKSTFVVGGWAHGTLKRGQSALTQPYARSVHQGIGGFLIIDQFQEPEKPDGVLMEAVVRLVLDRRDATHRPPVPLGQEELNVGVRVERVSLRIE